MMPRVAPDAGPNDQAWGPYETPYVAIGGEPVVRRLVESFYDHVASSSPVVRAMHPLDDRDSRQKLFEFLTGWLGGPQLYIEKRGHPRLRMRHAPFPIDEDGVREWLRCMGQAMDDCGVTGPLRTFLDQRFAHTAHFMQNR
jgi:hemoglobin